MSGRSSRVERAGSKKRGKPAKGRARFSSWLGAISLPKEADMAHIANVLVDTKNSFASNNVALSAAAIAYYMLVSLFPMALLIIALSRFLLKDTNVQPELIDFLSGFAPNSDYLLKENVRQALINRGTINVLAALTLIWSASGIFSVTDRAINRAWRVQNPRPFWRNRLLSVSMVIGLAGFFYLNVFLFTILQAVMQWQYTLFGRYPFGDYDAWRSGTQWLQPLFVFLFLMLIYKILPHTHVRWRDIWPGALGVSLLWELARWGFKWYLGKFAHYNLIYGSLGTVITFLLWSLVTGYLLLLGAEFSAALCRGRARKGR